MITSERLAWRNLTLGQRFSSCFGQRNTVERLAIEGIAIEISAYLFTLLPSSGDFQIEVRFAPEQVNLQEGPLYVARISRHT